MRQAKAAVYVGDDDWPFVVAETPSEIAAMVKAAENSGTSLIQLTLGNTSDWNGKPLFVRAARVNAISPPKAQPDDSY